MQNKSVRIRGVPAVTRAFAIMRFLSRVDQAQPLHVIAAETGMIASTCLHILRALTSEGMVAFHAKDKRYQLDIGILSIGRSALRASSVASLAQPALERIAASRGVVAVATQLVGKHMIVVAIARPERPLQLSVEVGSRMPAYISATGRCFAAFGPTRAGEDLRVEFKGLRWDVKPAFTRWLEQVEATRVQGWGLDEGHYIRGVTSIAAPVRGPEGLMTWGIVVVGIREQIAKVGVSSLGKEVRRVALGIEVGLQPSSSGWKAFVHRQFQVRN